MFTLELNCFKTI